MHYEAQIVLGKCISSHVSYVLSLCGLDIGLKHLYQINTSKVCFLTRTYVCGEDQT